MKKKALFFVLFFTLFFSSFARENTWGHLKKIYFYDSLKKYDQVQENLGLLNLEEIKRSDRIEITQKLLNFGDHYFSEGKYELAGLFYKKVLKVSPDYWYVFNKLENIYRNQGKVIYNFKGKNLHRENIEKAVNLSKEKYCGVSALYSKVIPMEYEIRIEE